MDFIYDGTIEVEPFKINAIQEIHIKETLNEHAKFYLRARLEKEEYKNLLDSVGSETKIKFKRKDENNQEQIIFSGLTKDIIMTAKDSVYFLEVNAVSNSLMIDVEKKRRSFQDSEMKYRQIVEKITKAKKSAVTFGDAKAAGKTVENIVLQYDETDWEFSKRLASHSNAVLIPKIKEDTPDFIFGVLESSSKGDLKSYDYSVNKDLALYRKMAQFPELKFSENDSVSYTITSNDKIFNLGDMLNLDEKPLYISAVNLSLIESVFKCDYTLSTKTAIAAAKFFNRNSVGLHLLGTVLDVQDDTIQVGLDIDVADGTAVSEAGGYWFKYATPYTAESHTGWYVMPEIEDKVQVIFPTEDEKEAYATTAIRQGTESDGTNLKTNDPQIKFLRTPYGKEIKFQEKEILITGKDDETFIRINEEEGIIIQTKHNVEVYSGANIKMECDENFSIKAGKNVNIEANESIYINGDKRKNNISMEKGGKGGSITTESPFIITSLEDTVIVESKKDLKLATKNFSVTGDIIQIAGKSAVDISATGSSIMMTSNVDVSGSLIKLN